MGTIRSTYIALVRSRLKYVAIVLLSHLCIPYYICRANSRPFFQVCFFTNNLCLSTNWLFTVINSLLSELSLFWLSSSWNIQCMLFLYKFMYNKLDRHEFLEFKSPRLASRNNILLQLPIPTTNTLISSPLS